MLKPFYIIPRTGGLAYLNMPKSACTSILHQLVDMRVDTDPAPTAGLLEDGSDAVHGFSPPYAHLEYFFGRWPLDHPPIPSSFITFTFVRNPYARFYSFYKSKIKLGQAPGAYYRKFGIEPGCSFSDCVHKLTAVDPAELEHHAAPQSMIMVNEGKLHVDYLGKVENFSDDWSVIQHLTGYDQEPGRLNVTGSSRAPVYTEELKECVYDYFRDDFLLFDYDRDSVELLDGHDYDGSKPVYTAHHLPPARVRELKSDLEASSARIRTFAENFQAHPDRRSSFFETRNEQLRELLQKAVFSVNERISALEEDASDQQQERKNTQLNLLKVAKAQAKEEDASDQQQKRKNTQLNLRKVAKAQANAEAAQEMEIKRIENLLHSQLLAAYTQTRKRFWKRMSQFFRISIRRERRILNNSGYVDPQYYFMRYPWVVESGLSAVNHYLLFGAQEGKNPSSTFNTVGYLAEHPHLAYIGVNPLVHFILSGETGASS